MLPSFPQFRVTIVDEDADRSEIISMLLGQIRQDVRVSVLMTVQEAIAVLEARLKEHRGLLPSLLLVSSGLPAGGWRELLRFTKESPPLRSLPVVIVHGKDMVQADIEAAYLDHANACVAWPSDSAQFRPLVEHLAAFWLDFVKRPADHFRVRVPPSRA